MAAQHMVSAQSAGWSRIRTTTVSWIPLAACWGGSPALAFDGTALTGYGVQAAGMGGVSVALPQDAVAAANNPAGMALIGTRVDVDAQTIIAGEAIQFGFPGNDLRTTVIVPVPEGGFNIRLGEHLSVGLSVFGTGLVSSYDRPLVRIPNAHNAYAQLTDYIVAPTISYRFNDRNAFGFSFTGALQGIRAQGVIVSTPSGLLQLPVHSTDYSAGYGFRFGYIGSPTQWLSIGIKYDTMLHFSNFKNYRQDLLASTGGKLNFPWVAGVGLALHPNANLVIGIDYLYYAWHQVAALGSQSSFNWHDQQVLRVGAAYDVSQNFTIRSGFSHGSKVIDSDHTAPNALTLGALAQNAITGGLTYRVNGYGELHLAYEHDFRESLTGTGPSQGTNIHFQADVVSFGYSYKF